MTVQKKIKRKYKQEFLGVLQLAVQSRSMLDAFLKDILTPQEYRDIVTRWQIVKRLAAGMPQREIAQVLKVSIAQITRGSYELRDTRGGFKQLLRILGKRKA